jgi:uncharacterized protein YciI
MKRIILIFVCFIAIEAVAQDTTRVKPKSWLGILTLTDKYRDEKNWGQNDQAVVGQHFQRLVKYKSEGVIVLAGRTELDLNNPEMMGLVIFYAKDEKEALQFMMDDPAVKNKIMQTKVYPYGIAVNKCDN